MGSDEKRVALKDVKLDPTEFDISVSTVLTQVGAENYEDIFRKHNIGQCTLTELTDEDLEKLGVDDSEIRQKIIHEVRTLPIYKELSTQTSTEETCFLNPLELADMLDASYQHLNRMNVSLVNNTKALRKTSNVIDCVLYRDKYASDVAVTTLDEITNILNSMELALHKQIRISCITEHTDAYMVIEVAACPACEVSQGSVKQRNKKLLVGAVGSAVVAILGLLFFKSLKHLKQ